MIDLKGVTKSYYVAGNQLQVLKGIDFSMEQGELVSIVGTSGSGKSTLMNIIGLLDKPDQGEFLLNNKKVHLYHDDDLALLRNKTMGFVFQQFFLLPRLTVLQNVALPLVYSGLRGKAAAMQCEAILDKVGMKDYLGRRPNELSGGQQQRVAIARALVNHPSVLLADEPTGALDSKTGQEVMDLFIHLNCHEKVTIIIITHDPQIAKQCNRVVSIKDGLILDNSRLGVDL